jgi:DNA-binding YbaB/EbfC family protein
MFQGLGDMGSIWKQANELRGQLEKLSAELKIQRTTGASGGGMVEVEINGALEVLGCKIEPQLFAQGDCELLEDLLVAAMNDAVTKGRQLHAGALKELTSGLQLPGVMEALAKIGGIGPKNV